MIKEWNIIIFRIGGNMTEKVEVEAQGLLDLFKFTDKQLIDKVLKILSTIEVEDVGEGVTRVSVYLTNKH